MKINLNWTCGVYREWCLDGAEGVGLCVEVVHALFPACEGAESVTLTVRRTRGTGCKLVTCGYGHGDLGGLHIKVKGVAPEQYLTRNTFKALRRMGVLMGWGEQYWVSVVPRAVV